MGSFHINPICIFFFMITKINIIQVNKYFSIIDYNIYISSKADWDIKNTDYLNFFSSSFNDFLVVPTWVRVASHVVKLLLLTWNLVQKIVSGYVSGWFQNIVRSFLRYSSWIICNLFFYKNKFSKYLIYKNPIHLYS